VLAPLAVLAVALSASSPSTATKTSATSSSGKQAASTGTAKPAPKVDVPLPPPPSLTPSPAAARPAAAKPGAKVKIAVMDVAGVQGVAPGTATVLTNIVVADVARSGLDTISKGDITAIIGFERQKQILGCSGDASCVAEIGGALGVDFMLTGQVGQIGSQYHVSLQLVDTGKAKVAARSSRFAEKSEDALVKATREATAEVLAPAILRLPGGAARVAVPALPPPVEAPRTHRSAWIAYGAAGALLVGGGITGYVAKSKYDDLKAKEGKPGYAAAYASDRSSIRTTAIAADVMLGGAVVAAGVGTWLWFRGDRPSVAVVPVVAPGGASVALAAAF
jgi:TolB-like protein